MTEIGSSKKRRRITYGRGTCQPTASGQAVNEISGLLIDRAPGLLRLHPVSGTGRVVADHWIDVPLDPAILQLLIEELQELLPEAEHLSEQGRARREQDTGDRRKALKSSNPAGGLRAIGLTAAARVGQDRVTVEISGQRGQSRIRAIGPWPESWDQQGLYHLWTADPASDTRSATASSPRELLDLILPAAEQP